ncbi:MAG: hypothetical protein COA78_29635 [Blastopirellula sp.]|nr:MAG: hypothetical protein COA78_29635 [Blastopirellula sp.]
MNKHRITRLSGILLLLTMALFVGVSADEPTPIEQPSDIIANVQKPKWSVGDQWVLETTSLQQQVSDSPNNKLRSPAIRWRFTVASIETIQQRPCYRIEILCLAKGRQQPATTIWVDQATATLCQLETQMPVAGGFRTVTENYHGVQGQASPVLALLTALPVDLPLLVASNNTKNLGSFSYVTSTGLSSEKAIGDIRFTSEVKQTISTPKADQIKGLLDDRFAKSIEQQPVFEVNLQSHDRQVRQLWQAGRPWPIFTDNGQTQSRLIKVIPFEEKKPKINSESNNTKPFNKVKPLENAEASTKPWSGYWWPISEGRMLGPLAKLDQLTGHTAMAWEQEHHPTNSDTPKWWGYCHAWSASAVMEVEPNQVRTIQLASGQQVSLSIGDQKALLAACHTRDIAHSYGDRFGDENGSEDKKDLSPCTLWRLLKTYVKEQNVPLVLDVEAGPEVWNFPVYSYEIEYRPRGNSGQQIAQLVLLMADDAVQPNYQGTKVRKQTYQFTFTMRNGAVVMGSGKWIGRSKKDHPDFAWYPYVAVAENPEVIYSEVMKLVSGSQPNQSIFTQPESRPVPERVIPTMPPVIQPVATTTPVAATTQSDPKPIVVSPMELVSLVANKTSSFGLDITVDRFDGGTYEVGEQFFVRCASEKKGYLYLIQIDAQGNPSVLFPRQGEDNRVPVDKSVAIPSDKPGQGFTVTGPQGTTRVKAIVTTSPLSFSGMLAVQPQQQQRTESQAPDRHSAKLRLHPTQRQQIQDHLMKQPSELVQAVLEAAMPQDVLGPFAQDQVTFYTDKPKASSQQQETPRQRKPNRATQQIQKASP